VLFVNFLLLQGEGGMSLFFIFHFCCFLPLERQNGAQLKNIYIVKKGRNMVDFFVLKKKTVERWKWKIGQTWILFS